MQDNLVIAYKEGEQEAKNRLFESLESFKARDTTPHLTRWKFGAECGEIKTDLIREFRTKHEQDSDCYPAQWRVTPFLERVLLDFTKFRSNYDSDESINFFVRDELPAIRLAYDASFDASNMATNGLYRDSAYWSDDLVAQWLGSNLYLETKAQQEINEFVTEVKGPPPTTISSTTDQTMESASGAKLSVRQAVILMYELFDRAGIKTSDVRALSARQFISMATSRNSNSLKEHVDWYHDVYTRYKRPLSDQYCVQMLKDIQKVRTALTLLGIPTSRELEEFASDLEAYLSQSKDEAKAKKKK